MNRRHRALSLPLVVSLAGLACQSSSADKGASTGESITKAADQIDLGIQQIDATIAALHAITDSPGDLTAQRKAYEKALASLESTAEDVAETASAMRERGQAYFTQWDQQLATIQNEDIRERSAERREKIQENFKGLQADYDEAKEAFSPFLDNLRDIRTALQADATVSGIDALKPVVKKVDKDASSVTKELKDLVESFRELGVKLSRMGPKPPEPEKK